MPVALVKLNMNLCSGEKHKFLQMPVVRQTCWPVLMDLWSFLVGNYLLFCSLVTFLVRYPYFEVG